MPGVQLKETVDMFEKPQPEFCWRISSLVLGAITALQPPKESAAKPM